MEVSGPSLPSNYVTILDLKKRWVQQQQQSSPKSNSNPPSKQEHESSPPTTNPNPIINQPKPDVKLHDSDSKTPNKTVYRQRNNHPIVNQLKPEAKVHHSGPQTADKHPIVEKEINSDQFNSKFSTTRNGFRGRNPRFVKGQTPTRGNNTPLSKPEPEPERLQEKKQEYGTDQSNSKLTKNKTSSGNRNPRFVRGDNPTGGSTPLLESELEYLREKKQEYGTDQSSYKHSKNKNNYSKRNPWFTTEQNPTGGSTALLEWVPEPEREREHMEEKKQEYDTDRSNSSRRRNHRFVTYEIRTGGNTSPLLELEGEHVLEKKQEYDTDRSNSKHSTKKNGYRSRNPRYVPAGGSTPLLEPEPEQEREHVQEKKQEYDTNQSNSKLPTKKNGYRGRNPRFVPAGGSTPLLESELEQVQEKKQEYDTDRSNSKHSTNKNSYRSRNPRLATDPIPAAGSTQEPESEPVKEKKQKHKQKRKQPRYRDGRQDQKEAGEPKDKTPPRAENVDGLSHNDSGGGGGEVEDVAAAVKEISATDRRQRINRRWGSGSFNGGRRTRPVKPLFGVKRGQTATAIWVKKVEAVPN